MKVNQNFVPPKNFSRKFYLLEIQMQMHVVCGFKYFAKPCRFKILKYKYVISYYAVKQNLAEFYYRDTFKIR